MVLLFGLEMVAIAACVGGGGYYYDYFPFSEEDKQVVVYEENENPESNTSKIKEVYESIEQVEFKKENGRALTSGSKVKIEDTEDTKIIKITGCFGDKPTLCAA